MPRKSAAALAVNVGGKPARIQPRPGLTGKLREIVAEILASVPPEHFRPSDAPLIEQYAQAILLARAAFDGLREEGLVAGGKASAWNVVLEKSHRSSVALAARLRMCPQARTDPKTIGRQKAGGTSWESILDE